MSPANTEWARSALPNTTEVIFENGFCVNRIQWSLLRGSPLGSSLPPCHHLPHLLTSLHNDDVETPWLSPCLPFLTGTQSQLFRKVKVVQKWSQCFPFVFTVHQTPECRWIILLARIHEVVLCVERRALTADRITQGYLLPVQASFPKTKTTTREPNVSKSKLPSFRYQLLSFLFVNIPSADPLTRSPQWNKGDT